MIYCGKKGKTGIPGDRVGQQVEVVKQSRMLNHVVIRFQDGLTVTVHESEITEPEEYETRF